jgi:hypothetical protein
MSLRFGWVLWINDLSNNMDMRFGAWNIRILYKEGSQMTVSKKLSKYRLDLVGGRWHLASKRIYVFPWKRE